MILTIVSIYDRAAGAYSRPAFVPGRGPAIRSFGDEVKRVAPDNEIQRHPGDFELHQLGTWDDNTGEFNTQRPERIALANDFKE